MVNQVRGEHYSVHDVEGTGKQSSILQFHSAHDEGDIKGTNDGRTFGCPASGDTAVASTSTLPAADEGQTTLSSVEPVVATSAAASKKIVLTTWS